MKRLAALMTTAAALAAPPFALANAGHAGAPSGGTVVPPSGSVTLTAHSSDRHAPTVATSFKLPANVWYDITVSGTISYYAPINYTKPQRPYRMVCGTPQGPSNAPVGLDAEFTFARPWNTNKCLKAHLPVHWQNFEANSGVQGWDHPQYLGSVPTAPTPDHTYSYILLGHNKPAQFRLDDSYYKDNYGSLQISLSPAKPTDCVDFWSFGFRSSASCARGLS